MDTILRLNPFHVEVHAGDPIQAGGWTVTPISRSVRFQAPFKHGGLGFIWNRPVAITVQADGGEPARIPVVDLTRQVQVMIWAIAISMVFFSMLIMRSRRAK